MSNRAIDAVRDFSKTKGSERLLLFMIAEGINKSTGYYDARIKTLMADCNMSERWVQTLTTRLIERGELIVLERTGHSSSFAIPIYEGEQGYDPQPCARDGHVCLGMHTPLSTDRETVRRDEWAAQRRRQRSSRKVKGVHDSAPPTENANGGARECTPPRTIMHPPPHDNAPGGARECTQYPSSNPLALPLDVPDALTRDDPSTTQKTAGEPSRPAAAVTRNAERAAEIAPAPPPPPPPSAEREAPLPSAIWSQACTRLRQTLSASEMASWILPAHLTELYWSNESELVAQLVTPGRYQAEMIERRYHYLIQAAIGGSLDLAAPRVALLVSAGQSASAAPVVVAQ